MKLTKSKLLILAAAMSLSACDLSVDTFARQEVTVEGVPHYAFKMSRTSNSYVTHDTNLMGGLIDSNDYRQNVMAIEAATGYTLGQRRIINGGLKTRPLFIC